MTTDDKKWLIDLLIQTNKSDDECGTFEQFSGYSNAWRDFAKEIRKTHFSHMDWLDFLELIK